ncbi:MAG: hypothetical protein KDN22_17760 [Verrucomicrobiae bacterium]|nr:hypothetical protein [Verrucomicrobiae bacterium]
MATESREVLLKDLYEEVDQAEAVVDEPDEQLLRTVEERGLFRPLCARSGEDRLGAGPVVQAKTA